MPHVRGKNHWTRRRCPGSLQQQDLEAIERTPDGTLITTCPVCHERVGVTGKQRVGMHPRPPQVRMKIHIHNDPPFAPDVHRIKICNMDGTLLRACRRVKLSGEWTLRQYNNPVPCGEFTVLYPEDDTSTFTVEQ